MDFSRAAFLANWEKERGTRIIDHSDLIVGTNTGGIIAIGLGLGFTAEIKNLYIERTERIFPPRFFGNATHWFSVKYSAEGLKVALEE